MTVINTAGAVADIVADSRTPLILRLTFEGRDMSAATFAGQVRQNSNEADDVDPLASFAFSPVLVTTEDGAPVSRLMAVLDETAIEGLPVAGEAGADAVFAYDIHATVAVKERVCGGKLTVQGGVTND